MEDCKGRFRARNRLATLRRRNNRTWVTAEATQSQTADSVDYKPLPQLAANLEIHDFDYIHVKGQVSY